MATKQSRMEEHSALLDAAMQHPGVKEAVDIYERSRPLRNIVEASARATEPTQIVSYASSTSGRQ